MKLKNSGNKLEKSVALFEGFLIVLSILTFSYLIGKEIDLISADPTTIVMDAAGTTDFGPVSSLALTPPSGALVTIPYPTATSLADPFGVEILRSGAAAALKQRLLLATKVITGTAVVALVFGYTTKIIAQALGFSEKNAAGFGIASGWGYLTGGLLSQLFAGGTWLTKSLIGNGLFHGWLTITPGGLIGSAVFILGYYLFFYKDYRIYSITYSCFPWQPKSGGQRCEECNEGQFPCSKYRCESLGASCEIANEGTSDETCIWVSKNDIEPPEISAWNTPLNQNLFQYVPDTATLPGDKGVIIKYKDSSDGCIPAFTVLKYGITLDKPGQCRVDTNRTTSFETMNTLISSGYYLYNHTIQTIHAGASELENEGINLANGGNYEIYVRCESKNGYANDGTFVFKYCVSDEPDTTAPTIELTNPLNNVPVQEGQTSVNVEVYTNKPSDCKWSHSDEDYDTMANTMSCAQSITEVNANMLYKCTSTLTGLKDSTDNKFYFRCKSYPMNDEEDRFENTESYVYTLIGTKALVIDSIKPNNTVIKDASENVKVTLDVKTSAGYNKGESYCYFKQSSSGNYVLFANAGSYENTQDLWLTSGDYNYDIKCCDLGGNCDTDSIEFSVETDVTAPIVVRIYNEGSSLKLITNEKAECVYDTTSCNYEFDDGIAISSSNDLEHTTQWDTEKTFYIKCRDEFGGQPAANECSVVVRPSDTF